MGSMSEEKADLDNWVTLSYNRIDRSMRSMQMNLYHPKQIKVSF